MEYKIKYSYYYKELVKVGNIKTFMNKYRHSEFLLMFYELNDDDMLKLMVDTNKKIFKVYNNKELYVYNDFLKAYYKLKELIEIYNLKINYT